MAQRDKRTKLLGARRVCAPGEAELSADDRAERIGDFSASRNWGLPPVGRVAVEIVPLAVSNEDASCGLQLPDQRLPFHISSPSGCRWAEAGAGSRFSVTTNW